MGAGGTVLGAGSCAWPPTPQFRPRSVADVMGDGVVRRTELHGALGAWYLNTERQPTPPMQVRAGRCVGDKLAVAREWRTLFHSIQSA